MEEAVGALDRYDLALANRRLAIIDLSPAGYQPMAQGGCTIVYNGEIYNYVELRFELAEKGRGFKRSATLRFLAGATWSGGRTAWRTSMACSPSQSGMAESAALFCARDRLGHQALLLHSDARAVSIFASEIKSILAVLPHRPDTNDGCVYDFLAWGWLDHTDDTFFDGIRRLPAGSYLVADDIQTGVTRYWEPRRKNSDLPPHWPTMLSDSVSCSWMQRVCRCVATSRWGVA